MKNKRYFRIFYTHMYRWVCVRLAGIFLCITLLLTRRQYLLLLLMPYAAAGIIRNIDVCMGGRLQLILAGRFEILGLRMQSGSRRSASGIFHLS